MMKELLKKMIFVQSERGTSMLRAILFLMVISFVPVYSSCHVFSKENLEYSDAAAKMEKGLYTEAIEGFSRVLEINPKHVSALVNRASAHFHLGHYQESIDDNTRALELTNDGE
jgi:tetratricopeptide (TPR) repeat protein